MLVPTMTEAVANLIFLVAVLLTFSTRYFKQLALIQPGELTTPRNVDLPGFSGEPFSPSGR